MDWIILELQQREMVQEQEQLPLSGKKTKRIKRFTHQDKLMTCTLFIYVSIYFFSFIQKCIYNM